MEQPYSFLADCLSKFHMASEPIQALWLVTMVVIVLGVTWLTTRASVEIMKIWLNARARTERPTRFSEASTHLIESTAVMAVLDPGTHALTHAAQENRGWPGQARP